MSNSECVMGQFALQDNPYQNIHSFINSLATSPVKVINGILITQEIEFPDVSFWQGTINWDVLASQTDIVAIRGGQGVTPDKEFVRNWAEARKRGLKRMVYWFYDDRYSPGAQAGALYALIANDHPEIGIVNDWETSFGGSFSGLPNSVSFMESVEFKMGRIGCTLMYTGYYWFVGHSNPITNASQYNYLKQRRLWLAWYSNNPSVVKIPAPWTSTEFWQYGTPVYGSKYGVQSAEIDMNWFNGTRQEFSEKYGGISVPPPTGDVMQQAVLYNAASLKIRSGPSTLYGQIGGLYPGDIAYGNLDTATGWFHLSSIKRAAGNTVSIDGWASGTYLKVSPYNPPSTVYITHRINVWSDGNIDVTDENPPV